MVGESAGSVLPNPDEQDFPAGVTSYEQLEAMARVDAQRTLMDVLGVEVSTLEEPDDFRRAVMTTTQTVGPNDNDGER